VELTVSGGAIIHAKSRHGVDTYFDILMPRSMKRVVEEAVLPEERCLRAAPRIHR
jgi:hypothetical protein